ncbi:putative quinol monooxygenase [Desulfovibrio litoralis]|uniref:Quinol monooxygenase YgiN n=1 Tax=Desulfovibrio litoralis DSM 11393 TaxID=1121455 RepID=A0A1M7TPR1_9BACT|nr:putative quinol monooxygenase [Desulfovibrio litoralis]SHN72648.1 Quinol monooxygenase YgiN [Desulfovibrio litoralis DSM 11393]
MDSIKIVAEIKLKPEYRQELFPVLQALVEGSLTETGNNVYDLTENMSLPGHFFVIEEWKSDKAIEEHNETPHFKAFVTAIDVKGVALSITKPKSLF